MATSSKHPRMVPDSFTSVVSTTGTQTRDTHEGDDEDPSAPHLPFPSYTAAYPPRRTLDWPPALREEENRAMPRVPCVTGYVCERREGGGGGGRVMLYLQDDDPSVSPLAWLGVGGAAGPIGWTASDGTVARDPSAAVAVAPPEPLDLSKVLKVQVPEDSAGVKLETWLSPDGKKMPSPCLELVRRSREVSNRIAEIEREQKMLMDDLKQASLLMRRSEHEVKILSGRASGGGGKREREQLLFNAKTLLSQRAMSFQTKRQHYVALAHQQKEEKRALDKIQDEIEKVRKGSGILAVFATPTSTSSARTASGSSMGRNARGSSMAAPNVDSNRIFSHVPREVTDGGDHARPTSQATYPARQRGPDSWISPLRAPSEDRHWNDREPAARSPFMSGVAVVDDILQSGYSAAFCNPEGPANLEMRAGGTRGRPGWCASEAFRGSDRKESSKEAVSSSKEVKAGLTLITARSPSPALKRFGRPTRTPDTPPTVAVSSETAQMRQLKAKSLAPNWSASRAMGSRTRSASPAMGSRTRLSTPTTPVLKAPATVGRSNYY